MNDAHRQHFGAQRVVFENIVLPRCNRGRQYTLWEITLLLKSVSDSSAAGRDTLALTRKRRCGLTVTRTFLTFFFSWKSRAEQTVVSTETEGSFVPSTVQSAGVLVCHLLHRLLNLLHDGAVQHLQLTGRPADGAHRMALQPRRDLRNLLRPVCAAVK